MVTKSSMLIKTATKLKQVTMDVWGQGSIPQMELGVNRTRSMREGEGHKHCLTFLLSNEGMATPLERLRSDTSTFRMFWIYRRRKKRGKRNGSEKDREKTSISRQPRNQLVRTKTPQPSSSGHTQGTIGQTPNTSCTFQNRQLPTTVAHFIQHLHHSALCPAQPLPALVRLSRKPKKREVANDLRERVRYSHSLEAAGHQWWESQVCCLL